MNDIYDLCKDCKYATTDYYEYYGGYKQYFIDGCEFDLEPYYDEEEECVTCEKFKLVPPEE